MDQKGLIKDSGNIHSFRLDYTWRSMMPQAFRVLFPKSHRMNDQQKKSLLIDEHFLHTWWGSIIPHTRHNVTLMLNALIIVPSPGLIASHNGAYMGMQTIGCLYETLKHLGQAIIWFCTWLSILKTCTECRYWTTTNKTTRLEGHKARMQRGLVIDLLDHS